MTFIDFFAGVGGIRTGMEAAGHKCVGFVEIDRFAVASYRAIHDTKEEFYASDIRSIDPVLLPAADCYAFGFPCQAFSISGRRLGFEDTSENRYGSPELIIFEILRLAQIRKPKYLFGENVAGLLTHDGGRTLQVILNAMGELGYFCEWERINSAAYLPQSRPRIYIVGHYGTLPARSVFPIVPADAEPRLIIAGNLNEKGNFDSANKVYSPDGISPCLDTSSDRPNILMPAGASRGQHGLVRRLSALEKWRLQGFSDEAFYKAAAVCSDSQLQKQAGNGVTVKVICQIAKRFAEIQE